MKKLLLSLCTIAILAFGMTTADAQIRTPSPSPSSKIEQTVGLTDITVEYSRPSVKGRTIFSSDGLVPYGEVWRTGANSATKITFSDDVKVGGTDLKAGAYAILTVPSATSWQVQFHPHESGNWGSYRDKEPAATVTANVQNLPFSIESFMILFTDLKDGSANLEFVWSDVVAVVPIEVEYEKRVMASIERTLGGPTANDYYAAANYYHSTGKDLNKALSYVQKATKTENPRFWQVRREALILADLGRHGEAIAAAKKSLKLAQEAGNKDYVRMNEKSIAQWSKKAGER